MREGFRELRNRNRQLLCIANDGTGEVETQGPHKSSYSFSIPIGGTFTVTRDNVTYLVTRTTNNFTVADISAA